METTVFINRGSQSTVSQNLFTQAVKKQPPPKNIFTEAGLISDPPPKIPPFLEAGLASVNRDRAY